MSRGWPVVGRLTRPDVRGPAGGAMLVLPANSCWGTMPLRADLLLLLELLTLPLFERASRWPVEVVLLLLVVLVMRSLICVRDRSDMLLSRLGVAGLMGESPAASSEATATT